MFLLTFPSRQVVYARAQRTVLRPGFRIDSLCPYTRIGMIGWFAIARVSVGVIHLMWIIHGVGAQRPDQGLWHR